MIIETIHCIRTEPQQILPSEEGQRRVFLKKRWLSSTFPTVPGTHSAEHACAHQSVCSERGTSQTSPSPRTVSSAGAHCEWWGAAGNARSRRLLSKVPEPEHPPKMNPAPSPGQRGLLDCDIPDLIKKGGGRGEGQVVKHYLLAQATGAEAISCPSNWGQGHVCSAGTTVCKIHL